MPLSTDVKLPANLKPVFPDRCLVCHDKTDASVRLTRFGLATGWALILPVLSLFGFRSLRIPVCPQCKGRFFIQQWGRAFLGLALAIVVFALVHPHVEHLPKIGQRFALIGVLLVGLIPYFLFETLRPRVFDLTLHAGGEIDYEFASAEYAEEFRAINSQS